MQLNKDNYFSIEADNYYLSNSQIKNFLTCSASAIAYLKCEYQYPKPSESMIFGQLIHSYFEGKDAFDIFVNNNRSILCKKNGEMYSIFNYLPVVKCVEDDSFTMYYLSGKHEQIITTELFGEKIKASIDVIGNNFITDIKTMYSIEKEKILQYGYDKQLVLYSMIYKQATGIDIKDLYIVAISKEVFPDHRLFFLNDDEKIHNIKQEIEDDIKKVSAIKKGDIKSTRCENCDYCKQTKKLFIAEDLW